MVGDKLLNDASGHYQKFKPKPGQIIDDSTLYTERRYYLKRIPPGTYGYEKEKICNIPALIINSFIDTLNEPHNAKLPDVLVILWNDHRFWNDELFLKNHMPKVLRKFVKEIKKIAEIRNFALPEKAASWENPRVFITKPLPLPNNMKWYPPGYKANRRKFTRMLQKGSARGGYSTINFDDFTCENSNNYFHKDGSVSEDGFDYIWKVISDTIHTHDKNLETLALKTKAKQLASVDSSSPPSAKKEIEGVWSMTDTDSQSPPQDTRRPARRSLGEHFKTMDNNSDSTSRPIAQNHHDVPNRQPRQEFSSSQTGMKWSHHHKPKRGRGRGYYPHPQPGFFPFNPFYHGYHYKHFNHGPKGPYGPY